MSSATCRSVTRSGPSPRRRSKSISSRRSLVGGRVAIGPPNRGAQRGRDRTNQPLDQTVDALGGVATGPVDQSGRQIDRPARALLVDRCADRPRPVVSSAKSRCSSTECTKVPNDAPAGSRPRPAERSGPSSTEPVQRRPVQNRPILEPLVRRIEVAALVLLLRRRRATGRTGPESEHRFPTHPPGPGRRGR